MRAGDQGFDLSGAPNRQSKGRTDMFWSYHLYSKCKNAKPLTETKLPPQPPDAGPDTGYSPGRCRTIAPKVPRQVSRPRRYSSSKRTTTAACIRPKGAFISAMQLSTDAHW